jgi:hypothetical protein
MNISFYGRAMAQTFVCGISLRSHGFEPGSVHFGFAVDEVTLGQVVLRILVLSPVTVITIILLGLHIHVLSGEWTKVPLKVTDFWDIAPCSIFEANRRFRSVYCLHHQDDEYAVRQKSFGNVRISPTIWNIKTPHGMIDYYMSRWLRE